MYGFNSCIDKAAGEATFQQKQKQITSQATESFSFAADLIMCFRVRRGT